MTNEDSPSSSAKLFEAIQKEFCCFNDGSVRDSLGNFNTIWKVSDFQRWWLAFETHAGVPLGRKLMNAATDQEEYFLNESSLFDVGWFMKKSKVNALLTQRWQNMGWGQYSLSKNTVLSHLLAPVCSGFALATLETLKSHRFKVQWRQVSNVQIQLETSDDPRSISVAPSPPQFHWDSKPIDSQPRQSQGLALDLQMNEYGWSDSGEHSFLLPIGVLQRLFESVNMQGLQLPSEVLDAWEFPDEFNSSHALSLLLSSLAMNDMVSQSERPIYIQDLKSWSQLVEAYMAPYGFGSFVSIHALDQQGGVEFELRPSALLPLTLGFLVAFWQRGIGRKARVKMESKNGNWSFQITSFLDYAE